MRYRVRARRRTAMATANEANERTATAEGLSKLSIGTFLKGIHRTGDCIYGNTVMTMMVVLQPAQFKN